MRPLFFACPARVSFWLRAGLFGALFGLGLLVACASSPHPAAPAPQNDDPGRPNAAERAVWRALFPGDPGGAPDSKLMPLARSLLPSCSQAPARCALFVESRALALGIAERPLTARLFVRADYPDQTSFLGALAAQLKAQRAAGFGAFSLAVGDAPQTLVWLAARRDLTLDDAPDMSLKPGEAFELGGSIRDDAGLMHWVWRTPQGQPFEENWPFFGGRFSRRLSLTKPGTYTLDIAISEITGQRRLIARRWLRVESDETAAVAAPLPKELPEPLSVDAVRRHLDDGRATAKQSRLADLKDAEKDFEGGLRAEALRTPQSMAEGSRPLILASYPYLDCRLFSLYGEGDAAFTLLDSPAVQASWQSPQTQALHLWVLPQGAGQRILMAACRFFNPAQSALYDWANAEQRRNWHVRREQKMAQTYGLIALDPAPLLRAEVQLGELLPLLALLWDTRADLPGLTNAPLSVPFKARAQAVGDELFVTLYETREALRGAWPPQDPRYHSLTRYLCSALLFGARPGDCEREARRGADGALDALASARAEETAAQIAAYYERREEAMSHLLGAMTQYQRLGWSAAIERLGLESAFLLTPRKSETRPAAKPERAPTALPTPAPEFLNGPDAP